ncbi:MAG TPA: proline dehydrogenase family protein, partial [Caulobacteraceae bacterium]
MSSQTLAGTPLAEARAAIAPLYRRPEPDVLRGLAENARLTAEERTQVRAEAGRLLVALRAPGRAGWVDRFLQEYSLSSEEGTALLGLAEAYLRVPDPGTADALIRDKLALGDWKAHLGAANSVLVNSATLGLIIAQSMTEASNGATLRGLVGRLGEPAIRAAVGNAMQMMGEAFVLGRSIAEALRRADRGANRAFRYSFDMLGEGARTSPDAAAYLESYRRAILAIGADTVAGDVFSSDSISVKLSALHPRYEPLQAGRAVSELTGALIELARLARDQGIGLTVDAEEAERLEMSLSIIEGAAR